MGTSTTTLERPPRSGSSTDRHDATEKSDELRRIDAYWRAANYLSVGQIYLYDNPLLREPLTLAHVKPLVVGHWGTTPGQNFIYVHLNRVIKKYDLDMIYVSGPGHGGPALVGNVYLEGTLERGLSRHHPGRGRAEEAVQAVLLSGRHFQPCRADDAGLDPRRRRARLFAQPCLRRRLRQSGADRRLRRRRRRGRDRPAGDRLAVQQVSRSDHRRRACCRSCISTATRSATRPCWRRIEHEELEQFFRGCGWTPYFVEGDDPEAMHELMAEPHRGGHRRHQADPEGRPRRQ